MLIKKKKYESGVNRLEHWIKSKDCAILSASRSHVIDLGGGERPEVKALEVEIPKDITGPFERDEYLKEVPKVPKRILTSWHFNLKHALLHLRYGVTDVQGTYTVPEGVTEYEQSMFVVNLEDNPKFFDDMIRSGRSYNQDCVLIKFKDEENAFLYGTNGSSFSHELMKTPKNAGRFHKYVGVSDMTTIRNKVISFMDPKVVGGELSPVELPNFHARKAARIAAKLDNEPVTKNGVPLAVEKALGYHLKLNRSTFMIRRAICDGLLRHFIKLDEGLETDSLEYGDQYFFDNLVKEGIIKERRKGKYDVL